MPVLVLSPRVVERPDEESIRRIGASAPPNGVPPRKK